MKKKVKAYYVDLRPGDCFRLTLKGPIYMKDNGDGGQVVLGKRSGRIWSRPYGGNTSVYQANVNIVEIK